MLHISQPFYPLKERFWR